MLQIDRPELTRIILSKVLENLPPTRSGEGYYIARTRRNSYVSDIISNFRSVGVLKWGYSEYEPIVGDDKRYEIAKMIIDCHIMGLRHVGAFGGPGERLAKDAKEQFVADIITDFHAYGFFSHQRKELTCKVAKILIG